MKARASLDSENRSRTVARGRFFMVALLGLLLLVVYMRRRAEQAAVDEARDRAIAAQVAPNNGRDEAVVEVRGMVKHPGVYRITAGDRMGAVLELAGAYQPDDAPLPPAWLGLSLTAGQRLEVGYSEADGPQLAISDMDAATRLLFGLKVDLNRASEADLMALPGVGPSTAAAIVAERHRRGGFTEVAELLEIKGIGPATLEALGPAVAVEAEPVDE